MDLFTLNLKSVRNKLIILFIIFAIIPSSLITIITITSNQNTINQKKNQIEDLQLKTITGLSDQYSSIVNNWIYERSKTVSTFAQDPNFRLELYSLNNVSKSSALTEIDNTFYNWIEYNPIIKEIILLNYTSGEELFTLTSNGILNKTSNPTGNFITGAKSLQATRVQEDGVYLEGPFNTADINSLVISFSIVVRPFMTDTTPPTEILSVIIDPNPLFDSIAPRDSNGQPINNYYQNIGLGNTGEIYLLNNQGIAISRSRFNLNDENFILKQNYSQVTGFKSAIQNGNTFGPGKNYLNQNIYGAYVYLGFNTTGTDNRDTFLKSRMEYDLKWVLAVEINQSEVIAPISQIQNQQSATHLLILIEIVILTCIVVVLSFILANSFSKPISKLASVSKSISSGDLTVEIEETTKVDEIGDLQKSFASMVDFLQPSIESISGVAKSLALSAQEMASSSEEVNASSEEMSSVSQQIAQGAQKQSEFLSNSIRQMESIQKLFSEKIT